MSTATATKFDYYNYDKILSFAAFWNFIIGGRGLGKTFGAKLKVLTWAIRSKGADQFVYMRRYKDELRMSRDTFTADIQDKFPDKDFRHVSWAMQMADASTRDQKKNREWVTIGYFIPLSIAQNVKSVSFHNVKTVIFDEFIIEKGMTHYLPNEAIAFQQFYMTVDRSQDKTRVIFLANSVTMENPYFTYYNIRPDQMDGEFSKHSILANGKPYMVVHIVKSEKFAAQVRKTAFGQFIDGTEYAEYALDNQFHDAHGNLVKPKTSDAEYYCTIETKSGLFSVWVDKHTMTYYVQEKLPKRQIHFTLMPERMDEKKRLLTYNDKKLQYMRTAYNSARMFFDGPKARNSFIDVFKR